MKLASLVIAVAFSVVPVTSAWSQQLSGQTPPTPWVDAQGRLTTTGVVGVTVLAVAVIAVIGGSSQTVTATATGTTGP